MQRVQVQIVVQNSLRHLARCFEALREQTFRDFSVLMIDNGSNDGSADFVKRSFPEVIVLRNARDLGSAAAHNQGVQYARKKWADADVEKNYVCMMRPEVFLDPDCLSTLVREMDLRKDIGAVGPKMLKVYEGTAADTEMGKMDRTDLGDAAGFEKTKAGKIYPRFSKKAAADVLTKQSEVFSIGNACALYRASALLAIRSAEDEYVDGAFFTEGEAHDLAWRLKRIGMKNWYFPEAVAYRYRGTRPHGTMGWWQRLRESRKSRGERMLAYRNYLVLHAKNETVGEWLRKMFWRLPYGFTRAAATALRSPVAFVEAWMSFLSLRKSMHRKRKEFLRKITTR